ncbi:MAG: dihydrofolate reductase family protein [Actinomycetota bacterium]
MSRKVIVNTFVTLDGVMQAPGGSDEDKEGGFQHGGWQGDLFDEMMGATVDEWYGSANGGMLLGRVTYEIFAGYWPNATGEAAEFADMMNKPPKYVASRTLKAPLEWENSTLLQGDVADAVRKLKEEDGGDLQVVGSSQIAHALAEAGLVDEYRLMIHPIVVGTGKRLFADPGPKIPLKLIDSKVSKTGVLIVRYEPA